VLEKKEGGTKIQLGREQGGSYAEGTFLLLGLAAVWRRGFGETRLLLQGGLESLGPDGRNISRMN